MKIVLVGAGSAQFGAGFLGDIFVEPRLAGAEIMLHDIAEAALGRMRTKALAFVEEHGLDHTISASADREEALTGADFVVISIEVGDRFALWDVDRRLPTHYGVRQIYGENGGPGGLFHSLRVTPPILEIMADVERICPEAVTFNFSNPMSRICTTVHRRFPHLKFYGLCHEIANMERRLPKILGCALEDIDFEAGGLNHFSALSHLRYRATGEDAMPDLIAKIDAFHQSEPGYSEILRAYRQTGKVIETETAGEREELDAGEVRPWSDWRIAKFVLSAFGVLPITSDSHFGEYLPWSARVADIAGVEDFYDYYRGVLGLRGAEIELVAKERAAGICAAIATGEPSYERAVNLPNAGFVEALPDWICVEVPAIADARGVTGKKVELPRGFSGLLANQIAVHDLTAEAILERSKKAALQALLVDPVVGERGPEMVELLDAAIQRQSPWLDYLS